VLGNKQSEVFMGNYKSTCLYQILWAYLNHSLKAFIDNSKEFIQYTNMTDEHTRTCE